MTFTNNVFLHEGMFCFGTALILLVWAQIRIIFIVKNLSLKIYDQKFDDKFLTINSNSGLENLESMLDQNDNEKGKHLMDFVEEALSNSILAYSRSSSSHDGPPVFRVENDTLTILSAENGEPQVVM